MSQDQLNDLQPSHVPSQDKGHSKAQPEANLEEIFTEYRATIMSVQAQGVGAEGWVLAEVNARQALTTLINNKVVAELESLIDEMSQVLQQPALGDLSLYIDCRIQELKGGENG